MKPEIADIAQTIIALIPGVPGIVHQILDFARQADTPQEFYALLNKHNAVLPTQGEKA